MERRGIARERGSSLGALLLHQQGIAGLAPLLLLGISSLDFIILIDECSQRVLFYRRGVLLRAWRLGCLLLGLSSDLLLRAITHILKIDRPRE